MTSASFVPIIRTIFRRSSEETQVSNDTEYAFRRSRSLVARIRRLAHGTGRWASIAFFVFAVLYVFSNEVSLRVARTVGKRLKRLSAKIESGEEDVEEKDMKVLDGWRWRILLWNE
jgi:predicted DNA-binding protein